MQKFEPDQLVLVRHFEGAPWRLRRHSMPCQKGKAHETQDGMVFVDECIIPYTGNEHLLGTTDSPTPKWEPKPGESVAERDVPDEEWNALPRPLRWTKEPPTEPGWYFCQRICKYVENKYPLRVVHIHYDVVMGKHVLCSGGCAWYGVEDDRQDSYPLCDMSKRALEEMWWAGPIQEPLDTPPNQ